MSEHCELRSTILACVCGIVLFNIGLVFIFRDTLISFAIKEIEKHLVIVDGTDRYKLWSSPLKFIFKAYIFNVTNPDDVMQGEPPNLVECGPYVYDEIMEKEVLNVDEDSDEITYMQKRTYSFNKKLTGNVSMSEKLTILNAAYMGSIQVLTQFPESFIKLYGENIPKLFPNQNSIFISAKPADILFDGMKFTCNAKKYPELALVCETLKTKKPPIVKDGAKENSYLFSFFDKENATFQGPYTVKRGVKNLNSVGILTATRGQRKLKIWNTDSCNTVQGSDGVTWPPNIKSMPVALTFTTDLCRAIPIEYKDDVIINGMTGARYLMTEKVWKAENIDCYCPTVNKEKECLPKGLLDVNKCQNVPTIISEPHFLHGDPELLKYAKGLKPKEENHQTYIAIEPVTGTPISGQKRIQFNMKLSRQSVTLLANVSEGYFPLVWCEDGTNLDAVMGAATKEAIQLITLCRFLQFVPLIAGVYIIIATFLLYGTPTSKVQSTNPNAESVLISPNSRTSDLIRRPPRRPIEMF